MTRRMIAVSAVCALLVACGGGNEGAGGVTAEESQQLNEAAAKLDAAPETIVASDETGLANAETGAETGDLLVTDNAVANDQ